MSKDQDLSLTTGVITGVTKLLTAAQNTTGIQVSAEVQKAATQGGQSP